MLCNAAFYGGLFLTLFLFYIYIIFKTYIVQSKDTKVTFNGFYEREKNQIKFYTFSHARAHTHIYIIYGFYVYIFY